jgi:hypothetical protein
VYNFCVKQFRTPRYADEINNIGGITQNIKL